MINAIRTFRYKLAFLWIGWLVAIVLYTMFHLVTWPFEALVDWLQTEIDDEIDKGFD